ncbi:hypothetical protein [Caballeronia sp. DA-9]|uniref:hypothetical protein n=1 Tax=Caballeronia sp. DA-9 TaxID=3436237 RepID=UPI003F67C130
MLQASVVQASVASPVRSSSQSVAQSIARATRKFHTVVAFDVTVPGLDSSGPRRILQKALGGEARMQVMATDRRHDCVTLHVEAPSRSLADVIGIVTSRFESATLGRATTYSLRR